MALITTWQTEGDWGLWASHDVTPIDSLGTLTNEPRIINDTLNLPFEPTFRDTTHIGINDFNAVDSRTLHRFGQVWSTTKNSTLSVANYGSRGTPSDRDLEIPGTEANAPEFTTLGAFYSNKNRYLDRTLGGGVYNAPSAVTGHVVSVWFKSTSLDYSLNRGIILGYIGSATAGGISWGIIVDTDNKIKAIVTWQGTGDTLITPTGGEVAIDTSWHNATLIMENSSAPTLGVMLIIDNNVPTIAKTTVAWNGGLGGGQEISVGGTRWDTSQGFAGYIDEVALHRWETTSTTAQISSLTTIPDRHRYEAAIFLSPVVDTGEDNSLLSSVLADYASINGSGIQFSFRASNNVFVQTTGDTVPWSGFTALGQVESGTEADVSSIGISTKGRYHQIRVRLVPSTILSPTPDQLQIDTPSLNSLVLNTSKKTVLLNASKSAFTTGSILGQIVTFSGSKKVDKVSLDLTIDASERNTFVVGKSGTVSFQAANFQKSRSDWTFQPALHWLGVGWQTSGTSIQNTGQSEEYLDSVDALSNAPSVGYKLFFPEGGTFDLWGYGFVEGDGIFYTFDSDITHIRVLNLGDVSGNTGVPMWTKFGTVFFEEGGIHEFDVYLRGLHSVILDQWYFTKNHNLENDLTSFDGLFTPLPLSKSPFMTATRLRSLDNGQIDNLSVPNSGAASVTAWMNNQNVAASGKFNYEIRDSVDASGVTFTDGLSLEFWQIGGGSSNFASWNLSFPDNSIGSPFVSEDFGQTYE